VEHQQGNTVDIELRQPHHTHFSDLRSDSGGAFGKLEDEKRAQLRTILVARK